MVVNMNSAKRYQPLIVPSDRMARRPIAPWRATLVQALAGELRKPEADNVRVAVALNQLALLEAYEGNIHSAVAVCDAQIRFWRSSTRSPGNSPHLALTVQPWINIVRLERWSRNLDRSMALYRELAPDRRADFGSFQERYDIDMSFSELDELDRAQGVIQTLDVVYWREYGNLLVATGTDSEMNAHLRTGMRQGNGFLRVVMLEMLLASQVNTGNYAGVISALRRLPLDATRRYWLPFKAMEMYAVQRSGGPGFAGLAETVMDAALSIAHGERDESSLVQLVDVAILFETMGMDAEAITLLLAAQGVAQDIQDEVVLFDVLHRLALHGHDIGCDLRTRFAASSYAVIRNKLGLERQAAEDEHSLMQAVRALAALDLTSCLAFLDRVGSVRASARLS